MSSYNLVGWGGTFPTLFGSVLVWSYQRLLKNVRDFGSQGCCPVDHPQESRSCDKKRENAWLLTVNIQTSNRYGTRVKISILAAPIYRLPHQFPIMGPSLHSYALTKKYIHKQYSNTSTKASLICGSFIFFRPRIWTLKAPTRSGDGHWLRVQEHCKNRVSKQKATKVVNRLLRTMTYTGNYSRRCKQLKNTGERQQRRRII